MKKNQEKKNLSKNSNKKSDRFCGKRYWKNREKEKSPSEEGLKLLKQIAMCTCSN